MDNHWTSLSGHCPPNVHQTFAGVRWTMWGTVKYCNIRSSPSSSPTSSNHWWSRRVDCGRNPRQPDDQSETALLDQMGSVRGCSFQPSSQMEYLCPNDSGHIPSMQHPICPTTSSVKQPTPCLSLPWWLVWLWDCSVTGTWKRTLNISEPYSIICHCCSYHHCCAITIIIPSIVLSCI